ncbi:putative mitochondrial protein, partial [Mucuna pruriens]
MLENQGGGIRLGLEPDGWVRKLVYPLLVDNISYLAPNDKSITGTKWIFRNKLDQNGKVVQNKVRLKQAPRAWYEKLSSSLMINDFQNTTLFCKNYDSLIIVQIYKEFEMSMIGELKFFFGLQIKQVEDEIYIHQTKYVKKFNLEDCKIMLTLMYPTSILSLDEIDKKVDQASYKGMIESLLYLIAFRPDITYLKGTTNLVLWIKHQLEDYDIIESNIPLLYDNIVAIKLSKNIILHSCSKHIEIKHHFIRNYI